MKTLTTSLLITLLLAGCASSGDDPVPPPPAEASFDAAAGTQAVGVIPNATLRDEQRNKELSLSIEYPTRGGPWPVIIFSHGYSGSGSGYAGLTSYWASYGYVCIKPTHADSGALRREPGRPLREQVEEMWDLETEPRWRDRVRDISLTIDSLQTLEERYPELRGRMDRTRIGVGGHSYGGFTTMLLAGMEPRVNGSPVKLTDPRVKAALAMSPQGISGSTGTVAQSWHDVRIPILYMTGTRDLGTGEGEDATWRRDPFVHSPAGNKYFVLIDGASHFSFSGRFSDVNAEELRDRAEDFRRRRGVEDPAMPQQQQRSRGGYTFLREREIFQLVKSLSLNFWDAHLRDDPKARERLQPGTTGLVTIETK